MMANILLTSANKLAFDAWVEATGISLVQINGQRKFGGPPPGWTGPPPLTGSEVFIGKLPQDLYEDQLIPLFQSVGKLYEFRLMMTFSGENRGFAYAKYANRWYAQCAIAMFNGYQIREGFPIVVCRSTEKNELCVRGIPWGKQRLEVLEVLKEVTEGVMDLSLHLNTERRKKMSMLAIVKYENHRAAAMAKKRLVEGCIELWGQAIEVDWVKPEGKQQRFLSKAQPNFPLAPLPALTHGLPLPLLRGSSTMCAMPDFGHSQRRCPSIGPGSQLTHQLYLKRGQGLPSTGCDDVQRLNAYCMKTQLGTPIYSIQTLSSDEPSFLFKVYLPGIGAYFSGTVTPTPGDLTLGKDVTIREAARQVLVYLGHSMGFEDFNLPNVSTLENPSE
ncbi:dead end protein homolog 1-like [Mustelus asterias]